MTCSGKANNSAYSRVPLCVWVSQAERRTDGCLPFSLSAFFFFILLRNFTSSWFNDLGSVHQMKKRDVPMQNKHLFDSGKEVCIHENLKSLVFSPPIRALVFIAHGAGEHCGPYDGIAQSLKDASLLVFAHDHGESRSTLFNACSHLHLPSALCSSVVHTELQKKPIISLCVW